jgi:hypothetical protein
MDYITAQEAADKWGITRRRVQILCAQNRIPGAKIMGNMWVIPIDAEKPKDGRSMRYKELKTELGGRNDE